MLKSLTLVFLNQGWFPLFKMLKINPLQLLLVFIVSEKCENIANFLKNLRKIFTEFYLCLAVCLEGKT